jgi:ABC-type transporter Mla MlaB component
LCKQAGLFYSPFRRVNFGMVTKSSSTRLLSRFTQLFRDPDAEHDSDSRRSESAIAKTPAEPSLKERFARKRRNDAIKAKELNQLRAILQDGRGIKRTEFTDLSPPSALVRTSGMGALQRNSILDKIDGAEAHLEDWWGTTTMPAPVADAPVQRAPAGATSQNHSSSTPAAFIDDMDLDFTDMLGVSTQAPEPERPEPLQNASLGVEDVALSALETCLRDAALHHAEGEFKEAQQLLEDMLTDSTIEPEAAESLTFSLFDVYRVTGQQDRFDMLALDYANRYGRSPGEWFSLAEHASATNAENAAPESSFSELARETTWRCPAILDKQSLADCVSRSPASSTRSFINWESLQHIDTAIAAALAGQIRIWCDHPVDLHWKGVDALLAAVQMCKFTGDVSSDATWWLIHLDLLCIQQQAEPYEEMAMDYCIAFEVSPPSWQPAKCKLLNDSDFYVSSGFASTATSRDIEEVQSIDSPYATCELNGNLTGEARRALRALQAASSTVGQITVSCSRLGRVDFNAASALLNWAVQNEARGCNVHFAHLPRLVLVFFEMLGMQNVARLSSSTY